jgi:protein-disulfide isomerase
MSSSKHRQQSAHKQSPTSSHQSSQQQATKQRPKPNGNLPAPSTFATSERKRARPTRFQQLEAIRRRRQWLTIAAVVLGLVVIVYFAWPRSQTGHTAAPALSAARLAADPSIGPANARVTLVEYGDFGCTSCLAWYQSGILQKLLARYGSNIRVV